MRRLTSDPRFEEIREELYAVRTNPESITTGQYTSAGLYHLRTDELGELNKLAITPLSQVGKKRAFREVLDFSKIVVDGKAGWRYGGYPTFVERIDCLAPEYSRCLLPLTKSGGDAVVIQEWDLAAGKRVLKGFSYDEPALASYGWIDRNTIAIQMPLSEGESLRSGTGRLVRLWKRGSAIENAPIIFDCGARALRCDLSVIRSEGRAFLFQTINSIDQEGRPYRQIHLFEPERRQSVEIPELSDFGSEILGITGNRLVIRTGAAIDVGGTEVQPGSIIAIRLSDAKNPSTQRHVELVFSAYPDAVVRKIYGTHVSSDAIWLAVMKDVKSSLYRATLKNAGDGWRLDGTDLPSDGTISIHGSANDHVYVQYESFLSPPQLWRVSEAGEVTLLQKMPQQLAASDLMVEQQFTHSKDRTRIPYFVIRPKSGSGKPLPTLLTSYGGFGLSQPPLYLNYVFVRWLIMKPWLERGGAVVVANIRGGGEYGPAWHQAATGLHRNRAFEDFIAVAEAIHESGLSSPSRLGVFGTSNGGLLVGATINLRPELFAAANIGVPLLDMLRFADLYAGATWVPEYGDPRNDPKAREFWEGYSPFHNLASSMAFPSVLVWGNGADDRVHPGHGRRYVERALRLGADASYFEVSDGGHFGSAGPDGLSRLVALHAVDFIQKLMDKPSNKGLTGNINRPEQALNQVVN